VSNEIAAQRICNIKAFIFINPQIQAAIGMTLNTPMPPGEEIQIQNAINIIYILTERPYNDLHNNLA